MARALRAVAASPTSAQALARYEKTGDCRTCTDGNVGLVVQSTYVGLVVQITYVGMVVQITYVEFVVQITYVELVVQVTYVR